MPYCASNQEALRNHSPNNADSARSALAFGVPLGQDLEVPNGAPTCIEHPQETSKAVVVVVAAILKNPNNNFTHDSEQ